jgi:hypothetical protein
VGIRNQSADLLVSTGWANGSEPLSNSISSAGE